MPPGGTNKPIIKPIEVLIMPAFVPLKRLVHIAGIKGQMKCVSKEITNFINRNFNLELASKLGLMDK
ncbi:MAG: hypothetical protein ACJA1H_001226 [Glaciecola sp.]|jgi:hypothetical protein